MVKREAYRRTEGVLFDNSDETIDIGTNFADSQDKGSFRALLAV
jgi:hypothetical protein